MLQRRTQKRKPGSLCACAAEAPEARLGGRTAACRVPRRSARRPGTAASPPWPSSAGGESAPRQRRQRSPAGAQTPRTSAAAPLVEPRAQAQAPPRPPQAVARAPLDPSSASAPPAERGPALRSASWGAPVARGRLRFSRPGGRPQCAREGLTSKRRKTQKKVTDRSG
jgi:hypothetical protein